MPTKQLMMECIEAFSKARFTIADAIEKLYAVYKSNAWEGTHESFSEFCEYGLQISKSLGSQYVQVYEHYVVNGSLAAKRLREVDATKLYLLIGEKYSPEEKLAMAKTLSRQEIKADRAEKDGHECEHPNQGRICFDCNKRLYETKS